MKKQKEIRFYLVDINEIPAEIEGVSLRTISDNDFIQESERQGLVYSLDEFQYQFNATDSISTNMFLRVRYV